MLRIRLSDNYVTSVLMGHFPIFVYLKHSISLEPSPRGISNMYQQSIEFSKRKNNKLFLRPNIHLVL